jgi:CheY-like chemotaxis protein
MSTVAAVVTDLFFQARISAAARAAGCEIRYVRSLDDLPSGRSFGVALVDLDAGLDVLEAIRRLAVSGIRPIIAFGPHLDTEKRKAARAAGADRVLAKSKFVVDLPDIMSRAHAAALGRAPQQ